MNAPVSHRRTTRGYTLVELAVATSVLAAGISAAASITMTSVRMEEVNARKARCLALTEGVARLWQLGLSPTQAAQLIPGDPSLYNISFNGETSDPATLVPTDAGTAVADPPSDLGTFDAVTIRTTVTLRDGDSSATARQTLPPVVVIR